MTSLTQTGTETERGESPPPERVGDFLCPESGGRRADPRAGTRHMRWRVLRGVSD